MKWNSLLKLIASEPLFESAQLLSGSESPEEIRRQLSRWTALGRLMQLRRGMYALAPPHTKTAPHPLFIASRLHRPSYVSLQSALAYHGVIPEAVPTVTSVTTARPCKISTPLGVFVYRHVQVPFFHGYAQVEAVPGQRCFMADAEKALLDLVYLTPGRVTPEQVDELRLDAEDGLDPARLRALANQTAKPKLIAAAKVVSQWLQDNLSVEDIEL